MDLYGREAALRLVLDASDRVVMISGDSGTGKSALLDAARKEDAQSSESERPILMDAIPVTYSPGSLQRALLQGLGEIVTSMATDESRARTIVQNLAAASKRLAQLRGTDIAKVVAKFALGLVRDRAGDMVADAIQSVGQDLITSSYDALSAQITSATDPGVVGLIVALLEELLTLTDGRGIVLALEDCENLNEDDRRALADLRSQLPPAAKLRFTYTVHDPVTRQGHVFLLAAGLVDVPLEGLGEPDVRSWIVAEGLADTLSNEIHAATGGYPALVQEAITLLQDGGSLSGLKGPDLTRRLVPSIWAALDVQSRTVGILVSPWPQPMPDTPSYVDIEPLAWAAIEDTLWYSRLFSINVGGRRWFHSLRRRVLWEEVLTPTERELALQRYRDYLAAELELDDSRSDYLIELARLTTAESIGAGVGPQLRAVAAVDAPSLAVLAAAIELSDPRSPLPGVGIEYLVSHARQAFGGSGDLLEAARKLHEDGLLGAYALGPDHVNFGPSLVEPDAQLLIRGRSGDELGRIPIAGIATAAFDSAMRQHLGTFAWGHYGVGHPRAALLSNMVRRRPVVPGEPIRITQNPPPGLLLRARFGDTDLYAAFSYEDSGARDVALRAAEGLETEVAGRHLEIVDVSSYPAPRVPSKLLKNALQILRSSPKGSERVPPNSDAWMIRHGATFAAVRNLLSKAERTAANLEDPVGIVYAIQDRSTQFAYVQGREGVERVEFAEPGLGLGPQMLRFAETLGLDRGQRIDHQVSRFGSFGSDPVKEALDFIAGRMSEFNASQERLVVPLEERKLEELFSEASRRAWSMAAALAEAEGSTLPDRPPRTTFVVAQDPMTPGFIATGNAVAYMMRVDDAAEPGAFRVAIIRSEELRTGEEALRLFDDVFGVSAEGRPVGWGVPTSLFADLMGYESADIRFTYPDAEGGH